MIAATLAVALAALPSAAQRYRVELGGQPVGWARLDLRCGAEGCDARWESELAAPEPADEVVRRLVEARTGPDGRALRVHAATAEAGGSRVVDDGAGPAPASLAPVLLSAAAEGERRCVEVREESSAEVGPACATRRGEWLEGEVLGVAVRFRSARGAAPSEVEVPSQGARFVADAEASLPAAPRLHGVAVPAAPAARPGARLRFCGLAPEPEREAAPAVPAGLTRWPEGADCRAKTARWLEAAARAGLRGRHVVGAAWDGAGFAWHEWGEVLVGAGWLAVDPSFRQLPARGPRFALARYADGDERDRQAAGRALLACWGRARVEVAP